MQQGAAYTADTNENRLRVLQAGRETALQYRELLVLVLHAVSRPNPAASLEMKNNFPIISRKIAHCVTSLVSMAEILKGNITFRRNPLSSSNTFEILHRNLGTDWEDPEDPTVIAENELLGAASSIDAAAIKLANLRPRDTSIKVSRITRAPAVNSFLVLLPVLTLGAASIQSLSAVRYV